MLDICRIDLFKSLIQISSSTFTSSVALKFEFLIAVGYVVGNLFCQVNVISVGALIVGLYLTVAGCCYSAFAGDCLLWWQ